MKQESFSFASRNADVLAWWTTHETHLPILADIDNIFHLSLISKIWESPFNLRLGCDCKVVYLNLLEQNISRVREFLDSTIHNIETEGENASKNIIVHIAEGEALVEDEVYDDIYNLDDIDHDDDEIVML